MRVIHVTPYFYPEVIRGIEQHVYELSLHLRKRGEEPVVYTCSRSPKSYEGIEVHSFPAVHPIPGLRNPLPSPGFFRQLSRESDIIHIHGHVYLTSFLAALASRKGGIPAVMTIHNYGAHAFQRHLPANVLWKLLQPTLFSYAVNRVEAVITPNLHALELMETYRPRRIFHEPGYAIDTSRFEYDHPRPEYILSLCELTRYKRVEDILRALPFILKETDIRMVIAGDGKQMGYLVNLARKLQVAHRVDFIGKVPPEKLPEIYAGARVYVAAGNAGYSLLEAAASGVPIVSIDRWYNKCILEDNFQPFTYGNPEEIARAIIRILTEPGYAASLADRAKRFVIEKRNWNYYLDRYLAIYQELLQGETTRRIPGTPPAL